MIESVFALVSGTLYGLLIGIIPSAGATTGLVALFGFIGYFANDPYLGVIFCMAVVAASTTGDTYSSILLGIPGANSAAATMVDGYPLAKKGQATYALTAAVTTSTVNGLIWGTLTFSLLPFYMTLIDHFGTAELWAFTVLALATVGFVSNGYWIRSLIAILFGLFLGMIGTDPITNSDRWTFGWEYLGAGIQLMPIVAGLFAVPELLGGLIKGNSVVSENSQKGQTAQGALAVWENKWDAVRGGIIGAFIGLLPGLGGAMSDWLAYGSTVAAHPNEKFGNGNIKGVIGAEGSNNAQKATSMIPTVLFGIPGASFAAVLLSLFMYLNFEMGTPDLLYDTEFFNSLQYGFMWGTVLVAVLCILLGKYIAKIVSVPVKYYFPIVLLLITWACVQYTGGWEDYFMFGLFGLIGILTKKFKFSRPAILISFILAERVENLTVQMITFEYFGSRWHVLLDSYIFIFLVFAIIATFIWGLKRKNKIDYV